MAPLGLRFWICCSIVRQSFASAFAGITSYASHLENTIRPGPQSPDIPAHAANARVQVFLAQPDGYSEVATMIQTVEAGQWNRLTFNLPTGTGGGPLRIDPADCPCVIELDRISIIEVESGNVLWSAEDPAALRSLAYSGSAALLDQEERCLLFSYGDDPQLQLPPVSDEGKQVSVTISLRLDRTLEAVVEALNSHAELLNMVGAAQSEVVDLRGNVNSAQSERQRIEAELSTVTTELDNIRREVKTLEHAAEAARLQAQSESVQRISAQTALQHVEAELGRATTELSNVRREIRMLEELAESARLQAQSESVQRISAQTALQRVEAELGRATTELSNARREIRMLEELAESARLRAQRESAQKISAQTALQNRISSQNALEAEFMTLRTTLQSSHTLERTTRLAMEQSRSWLLTKPLRKFTSLLRKQP